MSLAYGDIPRESPPARALKWRTSDCEVAFQLLPDSVACERSLFIDCGCAVRRFCRNMSLQQVHSTPENIYMCTYRVGQKKWYLSYITLHCTRGITFLAHPVCICGPRSLSGGALLNRLFNVCDVLVKQLLALPRFQILLLIVLWPY